MFGRVAGISWSVGSLLLSWHIVRPVVQSGEWVRLFAFDFIFTAFDTAVKCTGKEGEKKTTNFVQFPSRMVPQFHLYVDTAHPSQATFNN